MYPVSYFLLSPKVSQSIWEQYNCGSLLFSRPDLSSLLFSRLDLGSLLLDIVIGLVLGLLLVLRRFLLSRLLLLLFSGLLLSCLFLLWTLRMRRADGLLLFRRSYGLSTSTAAWQIYSTPSRDLAISPGRLRND